MLALLAHWIITSGLLLLVAQMVDGIEFKGWGAAFFAAIILGIVNAIVFPMMVALTIPITILTFGLFLLVINALMFWLTALLVPGFTVRGFAAAFFGSLCLALLNIVIGMALQG
jgi:putative membrane protein